MVVDDAATILAHESRTGKRRVHSINALAYPLAFEVLQQEGTLPETCRLRPCKYLNNVLEQDHRLVKRRVNAGLGFGAFATAQRAIQGYEAIHMIRKGQLEGMLKGNVLAHNQGINPMFGLAA